MHKMIKQRRRWLSIDERKAKAAKTQWYKLDGSIGAIPIGQEYLEKIDFSHIIALSGSNLLIVQSKSRCLVSIYIMSASAL